MMFIWLLMIFWSSGTFFSISVVSNELTEWRLGVECVLLSIGKLFSFTIIGVFSSLSSFLPGTSLFTSMVAWTDAFVDVLFITFFTFLFCFSFFAV